MTGSFEIRTANRLDILICPSLAEKGLPHGFTFRWRRVKQEPRGGRVPFGVALHEHQDRNDLARALDLSLVPMRQVHKTTIEVISHPPDHPPICDGLLTDRNGIGLMVQTADCVPLLMWDERQNVVAAVHAGWRGTLAEVARRAVDGLTKQFGSRPDEIHAAMGPSIGPCCYEVGDDVFRAFSECISELEDFFVPGSKGKKHLDLVEANRWQLIDTGVPRQQIHAARLCTYCNHELFYSYRKEGKGVGRLMGVVGVKSTANK